MADNTTKRRIRGARIDLYQSLERSTWAEKFGVTQEQLKEAVRSVGDQVDKVQTYLRQVYGDLR